MTLNKTQRYENNNAVYTYYRPTKEWNKLCTKTKLQIDWVFTGAEQFI